MPCKHPRMQSSVRFDHCPDCGYSYYYGDAHGIGEARISRLVSAGDSQPADTYCSLCRSYDCDGYCDCPD
jgi:hypothetical protein